jgi:hypothetical protein
MLTALLGSWGRQPLKDKTTLGTHFEMHAYRLGYTEVPAAKESEARNTRIIASSKAQQKHWKRIICKEHCGHPAKAVIGQATINLDSQVWTSLEYSLPKLYCVDLAEAHVMQEGMSTRLKHRKKE